MAGFEPTSSPPRIHFDFAILIFLRKMMKISHIFSIAIKSKAGIGASDPLLPYSL